MLNAIYKAFFVNVGIASFKFDLYLYMGSRNKLF